MDGRAERAQKTAQKIETLLCPSDFLQQNPITSGTGLYALTSYGGNGGSRSYDPATATNDGFFRLSAGSETAPRRFSPFACPKSPTVCRTPFFSASGAISDPVHDTLVARVGGGQVVAGAQARPHSTKSARGAGGSHRADGSPLAMSRSALRCKSTSAFPRGTSTGGGSKYYNQRLCCFWQPPSQWHNFALGDGSTRFIARC